MVNIDCSFTPATGGRNGPERERETKAAYLTVVTSHGARSGTGIYDHQVVLVCMQEEELR